MTLSHLSVCYFSTVESIFQKTSISFLSQDQDEYVPETFKVSLTEKTKSQIVGHFKVCTNVSNIKRSSSFVYWLFGCSH